MITVFSLDLTLLFRSHTASFMRKNLEEDRRLDRESFVKIEVAELSITSAEILWNKTTYLNIYQYQSIMDFCLEKILENLRKSLQQVY